MGNRASSGDTATSPSALEFVKSENASHLVCIWSKSWCPYCTKCKQTLQKTSAKDVQIHEIDLMENGVEIQNALYQLTGQRTVPNVFVNEQHLGGNDETQAAWANGKLQKMLVDKLTN